MKVDLRKSNVMVYVLSIIVNVITVFTQLTYYIAKHKTKQYTK